MSGVQLLVRRQANVTSLCSSLFPFLTGNFPNIAQDSTTSDAQSKEVKVNESVTGPEGTIGFQEVKVPRCRDNGTGWW